METTSSVSPTVIFILGVGILIVVLVLVRMAARTYASRNWENTIGTIIESRLEIQRESDSAAEHPIIVYEYVVNGQNFRGNHIGFGGEFGGMGSRMLVRKYSEGSQVIVYYDPNNPSEAVLERSAVGGVLFSVLVLVFLIALFMYLIGSVG